MTTPTYSIRTNNQPRQLLNFCQLTEKERKEYDYATDDENENKSFFRYRGNVYCLSDNAMWTDDESIEALGWHGIISESAFSAVLVKLVDDDSIIVGMLYS